MIPTQISKEYDNGWQFTDIFLEPIHSNKSTWKTRYLKYSQFPSPHFNYNLFKFSILFWLFYHFEFIPISCFTQSCNSFCYIILNHTVFSRNFDSQNVCVPFSITKLIGGRSSSRFTVKAEKTAACDLLLMISNPVRKISWFCRLATNTSGISSLSILLLKHIRRSNPS